MDVIAGAPRLRTNRTVSSATDASAVLPDRLQRKKELAQERLTEPFVGVTADGNAVKGLFPIRRTGMSLEPVATAATAFLESLDAEQRDAAVFEIESDAWRAWHNIHPNLMRHGICFADLQPPQQRLALAILQHSMSGAGFTLATDIMKLNDYLGELSGRLDEFRQSYYWMSIMGTPSSTEPWGWQIDGHHLIVNCFLLGDQIVLTPNFMGSEPVSAKSGRYAGTRVFASEEAAGFAFMSALTPEQRARATVGTRLPVDVFAGAASDNLVLPYEGIRYTDLLATQQQLLLQLIENYVGRVRAGHAEIKLGEVQAHLADTWFAWIGDVDEASPFYYRIHSPVVLIEFDHQAGTVFDNDEPTHDHIHTLVRTPNGNDYGRDLLRAHYEQFDHAHPNTPHRKGLLRSAFIASAAAALAARPLAARAQSGTAIRLGAVGVEDYALAYYAQQRGFFKAAGLDVELTIFPGGGAASTALYAGALDLSGTNTGSMSAAHVRGLPVALLAGGSMYNSSSPHIYLVAAKDGPIRSAKDLAGKKIAVTSVGDLMQAGVMSWIDKNGGDASQAAFLEIPSPQMAAAVLAHRIDATVLVEPFYTQSKNDVRLLGTPFDAVAKQFMITGWVANDKWFATNKATAEKFAGVMRSTAQWANANAKDAQALLTTYTKLDPAVVAATNHVHWAERLDPAMIQPVIDVIVAYKMLPHGFPSTELLAAGIRS